MYLFVVVDTDQLPTEQKTRVTSDPEFYDQKDMRKGFKISEEIQYLTTLNGLWPGTQLLLIGSIMDPLPIKKKDDKDDKLTPPSWCYCFVTYLNELKDYLVDFIITAKGNLGSKLDPSPP